MQNTALWDVPRCIFGATFLHRKNHKCLIIITLGVEIQRKKGDSNPRYPVKGIPVFETSAFSHSAILPVGTAKIAIYL